MDDLTGERVEFGDGVFQPGQYGKAPGGTWYAAPPQSTYALGLSTEWPYTLMANLQAHTVTEHEDGTISVSPSILIHSTPPWHGYLERGRWRVV